MKNQGFINQNARGNALVIILIMIALLAALTITFTRMGDNTTEVSQEQASVIASQVLRQAKSMSNAVDGLLAKGCSVTQLSFDNSTVTGYTNAQSPADKSCWLFDGAGAGMAFAVPPVNSNDGSNWVYTYSSGITGVGPERETLVFCTSNCQELMMFLAVVNLNICKAINLSAGVTTSFSTAPPIITNTFALDNKFSAINASPSHSNFSTTNTSTGARIHSPVAFDPGVNLLYDKKTACFEGAASYTDAAGVSQTGTGKYFFYQVLVER